MKTPRDFGAKGDGLTDDTAALQAWATAGGGEIPAGNFRTSKPIYFGPGFKITRWQGDIHVVEGWISGYALCPDPKYWATPALIGGVVMDASAGGKLIFDGNSNTLPRKGFGIIGTGWQLIKTNIVGGKARAANLDLFQYELRDATDCLLIGVMGDLVTGFEGCDWMHFSKNSKRNKVNGGKGRTGDDVFGLTAENPGWGPVTIADNHVNGGEFTTYGHSAVKHLSSVNNGSQITGTEIAGATFHVVPVGANPGQPVIIQAKPKDRVDFPMIAPSCRLLVA